MGIETAILAGSIGTSLLSSAASAQGASDQNKFTQRQLSLRQVQIRDQAGAEISDRVIEGAKEAAAAAVAMETMGASGSQNFTRLLIEIDATTGLDAARLEQSAGNELQAVQTQKAAAVSQAKNAINAAAGQFIGDAFGAFGEFSKTKAKDAAVEQEKKTSGSKRSSGLGRSVFGSNTGPR